MQIETIFNTYHILDSDGNLHPLNDSGLSVGNEFHKKMEQVAKIFGQNLKTFCFYPTETQKEYGVSDFSKGTGLCSSTTLEWEVGTFQGQRLLAEDSVVVKVDEEHIKTLFIDYLLSTAICYVEIPKVVRNRDFTQRNTYDKYIATKNFTLIAQWLGISEFEARAKYDSISSTTNDLGSNTLRLLKLTTKDGKNTVSKPRNLISTEGMSIMPVGMIRGFVEGFYHHLQEGVLRFVYLKDGGQIRELYSTVSKELLDSVYKDKSFVEGMLDGSDASMLFSKINRGYIKVPEFGASKYDMTGNRSVNLNRLLTVEKIEPSQVDLRYVNVYLDGVMNTVKEKIDELYNKDYKQFEALYTSILNKPINQYGLETYKIAYEELNRYIDTNYTIYSTQWCKNLHNWVLSRPDLFPYYTGLPPKSNVASSSDFGVL